jgi:hypothetical protein
MMPCTDRRPIKGRIFVGRDQSPRLAGRYRLYALSLRLGAGQNAFPPNTPASGRCGEGD